jgi:hypothetical protein
MRRILMVGLGVWAVAALVAACGDENPISVGSDLMGPGVRTYEVTLDPAAFLVADTTYDRIGTLDEAPFRMVAHEFDGTLEARTLLSLLRPEMVTYTPAEGSSRTDSIQAFVGATLTLVVDTMATSPGAIDLQIVQVMEEWHRRTATWDIRIDTAEVTETWATPGGSPGPVLGGATWTGGDTLQIVLDSAAVAVWQDTAAARFGGMIRSATPGSRLFITSMLFQFDVVPTATDTVVPAGQILDSKIIAAPEDAGPAAGVLRVGGLPAWRALLHFQPLAEVMIPCGPAQPPGCTLPLQGVTINQAALLLDPVAAGPRRLERLARIEARGVLEGPGVPLTRSPLAPPFDLPSDTLVAGYFGVPDEETPTVVVPVTTYVRINMQPRDEEEAPPRWLALVAISERTMFGYTAFGGLGSDRPPRLRLVVSVPDEVQVR